MSIENQSVTLQYKQLKDAVKVLSCNFVWVYVCMCVIAIIWVFYGHIKVKVRQQYLERCLPSDLIEGNGKFCVFVVLNGVTTNLQIALSFPACVSRQAIATFSFEHPFQF